MYFDIYQGLREAEKLGGEEALGGWGDMVGVGERLTYYLVYAN